jgi:hypothetical protein
MTTVRKPRGRVVHDTDTNDPTSTVCGVPVVALVIVDAPVTCKRCKR